MPTAFVSGAYTLTYGGTTIGQCNGQRLRIVNSQEQVTGDDYGDTPQDAIYLGGSRQLIVEALNAQNAQVLAALWPFGSNHGHVGGPVGKSIVDSYAAALVLTAVVGTPAATLGPASLTASKAIISPSNQIEMLFSPRLRRISLVFDLYPYTASAKTVWYTLT